MRRTIVASLAAGLILGALPTPPALADARPGDTTEARIATACARGARAPVTALGSAIAREAQAEHAAWPGHRIDAAGRLHRFGTVEAESGVTGGRLGSAGWWRVWRAWTALDQARLVRADDLRVMGVAGAADATDPDAPARRRGHFLGDVLDGAPRGPPGSREEALRQAAIRAAVVDIPWSAVFVSHVLHRAAPDLDRDAFAFSASHISYIGQALATSRAEAEGRSPGTLYRACDPHAVRPRPGDLLCYQREPACHGLDPAAARALAAGGAPPPGRPACRSIGLTHCEVVTSVDPDAAKAVVIGGNVFQSVTERRLNLKSPRLALSTNQGDRACRAARRREGMPIEGDEPCSLNARDWFVLLQMRR